MIGLSVAVGRFVEALFWAIFRAAGAVAAVALLVLAGVVIVTVAARAGWLRFKGGKRS